jgi:hypothetical protein
LDRRHRIKAGIRSPNDLIPIGNAHAAVKRMKESGVRWVTMEAVVGVDRRVLQRLLTTSEGVVTIRLARGVANAERKFKENPELRLLHAKMHEEGERVRWMVGSLMARGWPSDWIGKQVGWNHRLSPTSIPHQTVSIDLWGRVEGVFKAYHMEWGPSRVTAVRAWRRGVFFADCADWDVDEPDYRPIPGTLHPDYVEEACTYRARGHMHRGPLMLRTMHTRWGQWETDLCAGAAFRAWRRAQGLSGLVDSRTVCRNSRHDHEVLPLLWRQS